MLGHSLLVRVRVIGVAIAAELPAARLLAEGTQIQRHRRVRFGAKHQKHDPEQPGCRVGSVLAPIADEEK